MYDVYSSVLGILSTFSSLIFHSLKKELCSDFSAISAPVANSYSLDEMDSSVALNLSPMIRREAAKSVR